MNILFTAVFVLLISLPAMAKDQMLGDLFSESDIKGTIVISSLKSGITFIHNDARAKKRFPIASTFKILNTLISLEEKGVSGKGEVFKWDGHVYDMPQWNRDQTLESAFKVSCVWCFQKLAGQIGKDKYKEYFTKLSFGKLSENFEATTFWLDGSLQISALEQVSFLKKIYLRQFPFSRSSYDTLKRIMLVEKTPEYLIRAKTGWAASVTPQVGWYVGYVETKNDVWFFATNLQVRDKQDLTLRQQLTKEALIAKGIIE